MVWAHEKTVFNAVILSGQEPRQAGKPEDVRLFLRRGISAVTPPWFSVCAKERTGVDSFIYVVGRPGSSNAGSFSRLVASTELSTRAGMLPILCS